MRRRTIMATVVAMALVVVPVATASAVAPIAVDRRGDLFALDLPTTSDV